MGIFIKNINLQLKNWVIIPPREGPLAAARPAKAPPHPHNHSMFFGGNILRAKGMVTGTTRAADNPCMTLKKISISGDLDNPDRREKKV